MDERNAVRSRKLLTGMRFRWDPNVDVTDVARGGSRSTFVIEPTDECPLVAGPVFWLEPFDPDDGYGHAECANCGTTSKPYRPAAQRFAKSWAHTHRCPPRS